MHPRNAELSSDPTGLLLVGHGTRDPAGEREFLQLAKRVAAMTEVAVESCFLEICEPTIDQAIGRLRERGARRIQIAPLMLFAAQHTKLDIPEAVASAVADLPEIAVQQLPALGSHRLLLELSALRFREATGGREASAAADTLLVMVGRGSSDPEAISAMQQFAAARIELTPVGHLQTCFCAIARPTVVEALQEAATLGFRHIVVQPHLLFQGKLVQRLEGQVEEFAARYPSFQWTLVHPLGPHELLAQAVLDLARDAARSDRWPS